MASASLLKTSPVINKNDFLRGQPLRQPSNSVSVVRSHPSGLTVRASSYADELVKTAVPTYVPLLIHEFSSYILSIYLNMS